MNVPPPIGVDLVRRALQRPPRGLPAMLHMSPPYRDRITPPQIVTPNYGAVLILLYPRNGELHFVLMRRTEHHLDRHRGQISLPGGRKEPGDSDFTATALREAREELGIDLASAELLCRLTEIYIPPSNFYINPVVALITAAPQFQPDAGEVAELLEVPLSMLLDPQTRVVEEWAMPAQSGTPTIMMPYYDIHGHKVWGATAMVLAEFATLLTDELRIAPGVDIAPLPSDQLPRHLHELLTVYRAAFAAPPYNEGASELAHFAESLPARAQNGGFRLVVARQARTAQIVGFAYGYPSVADQWWHDTIAAALGPARAADWLTDAFEFVELAVLPPLQGYGIGGRLHDALLAGLPHRTAVLTTYAADTNAMMLYRKRGWETLIEHFVYPSDNPTEDKPFAVMGRRLPLP